MNPEEYAQHYLPRLGIDANAYYALIAPDPGVLAIVVNAYRSENEARRKADLLEVIWQHRNPSAIPVLAEALQCPLPEVWKEALNGLVAIRHPECARALESARAASVDLVKISWIDEALDQIRHRDFGESSTE